MKTKCVALLFLYLFATQYVLGVAATVYGQSPLRQRRQACAITSQLQLKLDSMFERVQLGMSDSVDLPDQRTEELELSQGTATGFQSFQWTVTGCTCGSNLVRLFVRVDFLRILLTFVMNLLEDLLGGLLGSLGAGLGRLVGNVLNLVVRIVALRIEVQITILQRFIPGTRCVLESYRVSRVFTIRLLGLDLAPLVEILSPLLTPIVNALLQTILNGRVRESFRREIENLIILRSEVAC